MACIHFQIWPAIFFCCSRPSMRLAMLMKNILTAMAVSKLCSASLQGAILGVFALGIAYDAGQRLFNPERLMTPELVALIISGVSVLTKELLYCYTIEAARRLRSDMLHGNAWDHRSDAISSIIVVVGVAGTLAGLPYLDALAAIGVALMIIKISGDLIWQSVRELIDTALDAEQVERIRGQIQQVGGVRRVHMLRTRKSGGDALWSMCISRSIRP